MFLKTEQGIRIVETFEAEDDHAADRQKQG